MKPNVFSRGAGASRTGFTLIELLAVISIMALLIGLLVAGAMKFKDNSIRQSSKDQANRLQIKLKYEYDATVSKCQKEPVPDAVLQYCGADPDRARAVHTAAMLRAYFPQTFVEAASDFYVGTYKYEKKLTFKPVWGVVGATPDEESAVLLYLILNERSMAGGGSGGETGPVGEKRTVKFGGKDFEMLLDTRGTPVVYYRWPLSAELDAAPYAHASPPPYNSIDPLDPKNLVAGWNNTGALNTLNAAPANLQFKGRNRVPTVVSYGKNKKFDNFAIGSDDVIGYQLNRQGN